MASSYTWHPGAHGIGAIWPLSKPLMVDELFSSWLVRVALAHGCRPGTLTSFVWPQRRIWTRDFDRGLELPELAALAAYSGISAVALQRSTLRHAAQMLLENQVKPIGVWPWVLVLGCRNRFHAGGLQCCPECFTQSDAYYRVQWRLAWHTSCPVHGVNLIDCCQHCHSPLQPSLLGPESQLTHCSACGFSLGMCARTSPSPDALAFQQYADALVSEVGLYGNVKLGFAQWMRVARAMISLLQVAARRRSDVLVRFCEKLGVDIFSMSPSLLGLPFEYLAEADRARLLAGAWMMMSAGPDRFMSEASRASLPVTALHIPANGAPDILIEMAGALKIHSPRRPTTRDLSQPRTQLEVLRMWLRLTRRMRRSGHC